MSNDSLIKIKLNQTEKDNLINKLGSIEYDAMGNNHYIQTLRRTMYQSLSTEVIDLFNTQRCAQSLCSGIIIDDLPIDPEITGSPDFNQTGKQFKSGVLSENIITGLASLVGEPYSIYFEGKELVNNLTPQATTKYDYTGLGSEVELDFHIENAALQYIGEDDYSPMGIFFMGIRIDEHVEPPKTFIADARKALKLISQSDIEILYGNNFYLNLPHRWRETFHHSKVHTDACPVIRGSLSLPRISVAFYKDMVLPIGEAPKRALDNLYQAINAVTESIMITPGKLVYVDNRFTLHSRSKFTPTYDKNGHPYRWLHRVFVAANLWPYRDFQSIGDRVFLPKKVYSGVNDVSKHLSKVA